MRIPCRPTWSEMLDVAGITNHVGGGGGCDSCGGRSGPAPARGMDLFVLSHCHPPSLMSTHDP